MPTTGTRSGLSGFPRDPRNRDTRTRRAAQRLAGTQWFVSNTSIYINNEGQIDLQLATNILTNSETGLAFATQTANKVLAGPTTGAAATPAFRSIVAADLGTGTADNTKFLRGDLTWQAFTVGTVTSVAMTVPSILSISGSPITSSGTLALSLTSQAANTFFAGPSSGGSATPSFRVFALADMISVGAHCLIFGNTSIPVGNTVANSTTATKFTSSGQLPANIIQAGAVLTIKAAGLYGTAVAGPLLTVEVLIGGVSVASSSAMSMTGSVSNSAWSFEAQAVFFTAGASATFDIQGHGRFETTNIAALQMSMPNGSTGSLDTTTTNQVEIRITWGTANASNTITLRQLTVMLAP